MKFRFLAMYQSLDNVEIEMTTTQTNVSDLHETVVQIRQLLLKARWQELEIARQELEVTLDCDPMIYAANNDWLANWHSKEQVKNLNEGYIPGSVAAKPTDPL